VECRVQFGEFVRLQIGDSATQGYKNWYRISDFFASKTHIKYKKAAGGMIDNGSFQTLDNDGY
jgi:hypothetical protein